VFEDNVAAMIDDKSNAPTVFPYLLRQKPGATTLPVFAARETDPTHAMSYSTVSKIFNKLCAHLGFERTLRPLPPLRIGRLTHADCTFRSFRYAWCGTMNNKIPVVRRPSHRHRSSSPPADLQEHLKYLLGHRFGSDLAKNTYQVPDRPLDLTGVRYNDLGVDMTVSDAHSSVAWEVTVQGHEPIRGISLKDFINDRRIEPLAVKLFKAEEIVHNKYGKTSLDIESADLSDKDVEAAFEIWQEIAAIYTTLSTQVCSRSIE
jgi:hypothetical protein